MKTNVRWMGPGTMRFIADTGSGHLIGMDGAPEGGGDNLAARPMELMLAGAGGCTAYDVVLILKKGRHDVRGCQVQLEADRADTDPKMFTRIKVSLAWLDQYSRFHRCTSFRQCAVKPK